MAAPASPRAQFKAPRAARKSAVEEAVDALIAGQEAQAVYKQLASKRKKGCSLQTAVSNVRKAYLSRPAGNTHPQRKKSLEALVKAAPAELKERVRQFRKASLFEQYRDAKRLRDMHDSPAWQQAVGELKLFRDNFIEFRGDSEDYALCQKQSRERRMGRNMATVVVDDADEHIKVLQDILRNADTSDSFGKLGAALCAASGRRSSEIMGQRGTFEPLPKTIFGARFSGQIKTRGEVVAPYAIPLLVEHATFHRALGILTEIQDRNSAQAEERGGKGSVLAKNLDFEGVRKRYSPGLLKAANDLFSANKVHELRGIYINIVHKAFTFVDDKKTEVVPSPTGVIIGFLGHGNDETAQNYTNYTIRNLSQHFGEFSPPAVVERSRPT